MLLIKFTAFACLCQIGVGKEVLGPCKARVPLFEDSVDGIKVTSIEKFNWFRHGFAVAAQSGAGAGRSGPSGTAHRTCARNGL